MNLNITANPGTGNPGDESIHTSQVDAIVGRPLAIEDTRDVLSAFAAGFSSHS